MNYKRVIAISLLYLCLSSAAEAEMAEVRGIRHWSSSGHTRVVVDLSQPVEFNKNRLSNPDRLYFDLRNSKIVGEIKRELPVGDGILKSIRAGQFSPDTVRVVLDLETIENYEVFILDDPTRLVIDVNAKRPERITTRKIVVIDPGHGGHDPGAIGPRGLREKDVVLDIALKVRDMLSNDPSVEVSLTRQTDVFIPLEERTAIARNKDADLFVSIHANASPKRVAKGVETYLLNWTNDEEAIRVAARENQISLKRMREKMERYKRDVVDLIKSDLSRQYNRDESVALANYVQGSIVSTVRRIHKNIQDLGVKQALFYVLVGASMPSILVEVSFISNPDEERLLSNEGYRRLIAASIATGIREYLRSQSGIQKVADRPGPQKVADLQGQGNAVGGGLPFDGAGRR